MAVKVGRSDFKPRIVHLAQRRFVFEPRVLIVQKSFDLQRRGHEKSPFRIFGGSMILHCCMNASNVKKRSSVFVYAVTGAGIAHLSP